MKKKIFISAVLLSVFGLTYYFLDDNKSKVDKLEKKSKPNDMFLFQRSYPDEILDMKAINQAFTLAKQIANQKSGNKVNGSWTLEGPTNIGGRLNAIEVDPNNSNIIYTGSAAGGIFKTIDGGTTWFPIADDLAYLAISDITIDPSNSDVVYAASGDHNISGLPHIGNGVYKSVDGGSTWTHKGLEKECIISKVLIDPNNNDVLYAAAMGKPFVRNNDRGLYKSTDGGDTWNQIHFVSDSAGIIDVVMDPFNSSTLYCASWNRIRTNQESMTTGNDGRIWKSTDAGASWTMLSGGLPNYPVSRIGLEISKQTPNMVFAVVVGTNHELEGVYKTTDGGNNWNILATSGLDTYYLGGFGWYFGQIRVSPYNDDEISLLGVELQSTVDGGTSWFQSVPNWWDYTVHADDHDLIYIDSTTILLATDGGLYKTVDNMSNWTDIDEIPNSQFYRIAVDPHNIGTYAGGLQDNGTTAGNSSSLNTWPRIFGGDGFTVIYDPFDPDLMYYETQNGNMYYDEGFGATSFNDGIDGSDRRNWDMQFIMSSHDNLRFYTGTYRIYQNIGAPSGIWSAISGDLTDGVIYGDAFHTISTVAESPINDDILYAGTTDGNVWVTLDQGNIWDSIMTGLPNRYVTDIKASPTNVNTVYVCHSGYKYNDSVPHIHKSTDNGSTWTSISGDLPPFAINDMHIQPNTNDSVLYVATDGGVYTTVDAGSSWYRVGDMPYIPVFDVDVDTVLNRVVAGTFARSLQTFPVDSVLKLRELKDTTPVNPDPDPDPGVGFEDEINGYKIYPNPVTHQLNFEFKEVSNIKLINSEGKILDEQNLKNGSFDMSEYKSGMYIVLINDSKSEKIIKK